MTSEAKKAPQWKDEYNTGITEIDAQHQQLFALVHELLDHNQKEDNNADKLKELFDKLAQYITVHFFLEERLMTEANYAGLNAHRRQHQVFEGEISELRGLIFSPQTQNINEKIDDLTDFLLEWLVEHIGKTDKGYVPFLKR